MLPQALEGPHSLLRYPERHCTRVSYQVYIAELHSLGYGCAQGLMHFHGGIVNMQVLSS
jgi:hypothetical protein